MPTTMPVLETERLQIRPFVMDDLHEIHRILSAGFHDDLTLEARHEWLSWAVANVEQLAQLNQPPYGDRAIVLRETGALIGSVGFVPLLLPFGELRSFETPAPFYSPEFAMFWVIDPSQQRRGYASEAARAMLDYAFTHLHLHRVVATTAHDNVASQSVMRQMGMRLVRNPHPEPPWLQVVGVINA